MADEEEYRIVDDAPQPHQNVKIPRAYVVVIKGSVNNTKKYMELLEKYRVKKR